MPHRCVSTVSSAALCASSEPFALESLLAAAWYHSMGMHLLHYFDEPQLILYIKFHVQGDTVYLGPVVVKKFSWR